MQRILVINVNWLGDVIFSGPVFKALKRQFPAARVACLAVPRVREILEMIPAVDEVILYDERGAAGTPWAKWALIRSLRKRNFDAAFLLHRSLTRALLVYLAGIPVRVGQDAKGRGFLLTHKVVPLPATAHRCDHYLNVVESFGVKVEDRVCDLKVDAVAQEQMEAILAPKNVARNDELILLNPGGNWDLKRWPRGNFIDLAYQLNRKFPGKVIVSGSAQDKDLPAAICRKGGQRCVDLSGQLNLKQLVALMRRVRVVVSADSGPLHLANAVGTSVVGLFGPTRPEVTGPRGRGKIRILQKDVGCNRSPCYNLACPDNVCMQSIGVEEVLHEVFALRN